MKSHSKYHTNGHSTIAIVECSISVLNLVLLAMLKWGLISTELNDPADYMDAFTRLYGILR